MGYGNKIDRYIRKCRLFSSHLTSLRFVSSGFLLLVAFLFLSFLFTFSHFISFLFFFLLSFYYYLSYIFFKMYVMFCFWRFWFLFTCKLGELNESIIWNKYKKKKIFFFFFVSSLYILRDYPIIQTAHI